MYDIFYISTVSFDTENWLNFKSRYPTAQQLRNTTSFDQIKKKAFTKMFWVIWDNMVLSKDFDLQSYSATEWDNMYIHTFKNGDFKEEGLCLFPKASEISKREFDSRYFINRKEIDIVATTPKPYDIFYIDTHEEYLNALETSTTELFWMSSHNLKHVDTFKFDLYFKQLNAFDRTQNHAFVHRVNNKNFYNGVFLCSTHLPLSKKEINYRFPIARKEWDIVASGPCNYERFIVDTYEDYQTALATAKTEMFWCVWAGVDIIDETVFDLYFEYHEQYERDTNHVFKNMCNETASYLSGIVLCSKNKTLSNREISRRYLVDKKEHDVVASRYRYPKYNVVSYEEYEEILANEKQKMFWIVWSDIEVIDNTVFDLYFDPNDGKYDFDRDMNHVFKNACDKVESYLSGVVLCSKNKMLSRKEFSRKFLIDKKEHDIVASRYRYPRYTVSSFEEYEKILANEKQKMFWLLWPETHIINNCVFDLYFDPNDGKYDFDREMNHVFKNLCNEKESYLGGIILCSKNKTLSKKEFSRKFLIDKKEHDVVASRYRYPQYTISSYEEYKDILSTETQKMFWVNWSEIEITDTAVLDLYFDPNDGKYEFDRNINHVFENKFRNETNYNGIMLMSTAQVVTKKEIDFRFLISKKEHAGVVSQNRLYDIVFISYNEPTADKNFQELQLRFPNAKRVHGVKGIHQAHIKAAEIATTEMFWVVDGDAIVIPNFDFTYVISRYERDIVHVWQSQNPLNDLTYGYGGVKLLPRDLTLSMDVGSTDMTTSISSRFKSMPEVSNITAFNTDSFATWRSAFRECVKLSSKIINRQDSTETIERLDIWCTVAEGRYAQDAIRGAIAGRKYGEENKDSPEMLSKINDFDWLKQQHEI